MNLDDTQKKKVAEWIAQGAKLSEIQNRLTKEFSVSLTYMETRMLVDDLKLMPKDPEPPPKPVKPVPATALSPDSTMPAAKAADAIPGGVTVSVDKIARPGALVSGKVSFSDGQSADWHLDQTGRLGLLPKQTGYRPSAADVQQFQLALQTELAKLGL